MNDFKTRLKSGGHLGILARANDKVARELAVAMPTPNEDMTNNQKIAAYDRLMNGPRSQRPTFRAVRKTVRRMVAGLSTNGSWRSWPAI